MNVPAVEVKDLSYTYAGRREPTLKNVCFTIGRGTSTLLVGRSGSGKSTLLRAMAGPIPNHSAGMMGGSVRLCGVDTRGALPAELAMRAGLVLQSPDDQIVSSKVAAEVAFGLENLCMPPREIHSRVGEALERAGLGGLEDAHCGHLSGGQKQRLVLAAVLAMRPRVLLLDEPLSQLDPCGARELLDQLRTLVREGLAIVVAEHRLGDTLPLAERVLVLSEGRLTADLSVHDEAQLAAALSSAGLELPDLAEFASALGYGPVMSVDRLVAHLGKDAICVTTRRHEVKIEERPLPTFQPGSGGGDIFPSESAGSNLTCDGPALLRVDNLEFRYRRDERATLSSVSMTIGDGERVALVGPNGCGKSTLLAVVAGLLKPSRGTVSLFPSVDGAAVSLVLQNPDLSLFCETVRDELSFGPRQSRLDEETIARRVDAAAQLLDLEPLLAQPPQALSQGQRLRVAVAATLALNPRLLLLDEPTTGQDPRHVAGVLDAVTGVREQGTGKREQGRENRECHASLFPLPCSLLFTTHDLRCVAHYADRVLVLIAGRLVADCSPVKLLDDEQLLSQARLRLPPLFEARRRLGLRGITIGELKEELR
jgi:energy-coupling factor transport system ATP-binding protein